MTGQETLIYIEENDKLDAGILAKGFAKEDIKNRAYINALGAQLAKKYLTSEDIDISNTYNLHSIHKILEEIDIADIMLSNIHIDVRVIFNEDYIFIPKSHFELEILPDIYLVFSLSNDHTYVKFLGFFEPKLINKNNQNEEYYFIEKEKLTSPLNLKEYITSFNGNTVQDMSRERIELADTLMISMIDHDITDSDKKELLQNLIKSAILRDRFIEFENFELLAYKAEHSPEVIKPAAEDITANFGNFSMPEEIIDFSDVSANDNSQAYENIADSFAAGMTGGIIGTAATGSAAAGEEALTSALDGMDILANKAIDELSSNTTTDDSQTEDNFEFLNDSAPALYEEENLQSLGEEISEPLEENIISFDEIEVVSDTSSNEISQEVVPDEIIEDISNVSDTLEDENEILTPDEPALVENAAGFEELELPPQETFLEENTETAVENEEVIEELTQTQEETTDYNEISPGLDLSDLEAEADLDNDAVIENNLISEPEMLEEPLLLEEAPLLEDTVEANIELTEELTDIDTSEIQNSNELTAEEPEMEFDSSETAEITFNEPLNDIEPELEFESSSDDLFESSIDEMITDDDNTDVPAQKAAEPVILRSTEETVNFDDINTDNVETPKISSVIEEETVNFDDINLQDELELEETAAAEELGLDIPDEAEDEPDTGSEEIAELDLEAEDIGAVEAKDTDEDIDIDDLKEIGIDVEELPASGEEVSSSELISQIDDLLSEETQEKDETFDEENSDISFNEDIINSEEDYLTEEDIAGAEDADNDKLEMLFSPSEGHESVESLNSADVNEDYDGTEEVYNQTMKPEQGKKGILIAAAVVAVLAVTAGAGMFLLKGKNSGDGLAQNPAENELPAPSGVEQTPPDTIIPPGTPDNTNLMTNAPEINKLPAPSNKTAKNDKELKNTAPAQKTQTAKPGTAMPYVNVNKVMWEVPDYLSYSDKIKDYLQTAGKSIKLTLNSDLLLASEYAYSNQVKVDLKLRNDGSIINAQISKSSGSNEINDIVLRTVKETLNVVKPASGEVPTPDFKLGLIIYF